jgi:hypothetical protein
MVKTLRYIVNPKQKLRDFVAKTNSLQAGLQTPNKNKRVPRKLKTLFKSILNRTSYFLTST